MEDGNWRSGAAASSAAAAIGGGLMVLEAAMIGVVAPLSAHGHLTAHSALFGLAVALLGAVTIWAALMLRRRPRSNMALGAVMVGMSMTCMMLAGGGFIIGSVLGIAGGGWAMMAAAPAPQEAPDG